MPLRRYSNRMDRTVYYFYDDFVGSNYDNRWWTARGTGGSITTQTYGIVRVRANANLNYEFYQNDLCDFSVAKLAVQTARWRISAASLMSGEVGFEAASPDSGSNWICFIYDSDTGSNWYVQSASGGSVTTTNTGVAADTSYHEFKISCTSTELTFFLDGTLVATVTTNIPTNLLQPYVFVVSKTGTTRDVFLDYIEAYGERAT